MKIGGWKPEEGDGVMYMRTPDQPVKSYLDDSMRSWRETEPSLVQPMFDERNGSNGDIWNEVEILIARSSNSREGGRRYRPRTADIQEIKDENKNSTTTTTTTRVNISKKNKNMNGGRESSVVLSRVSSGLITSSSLSKNIVKLKIKPIPSRSTNRSNLVSRKGVLLAERYPIGHKKKRTIETRETKMNHCDDDIKTTISMIKTRRPQTTSVPCRSLNEYVTLSRPASTSQHQHRSCNSLASNSSCIGSRGRESNAFPSRPTPVIIDFLRHRNHHQHQATSTSFQKNKNSYETMTTNPMKYWRTRYSSICSRYDI